MRALGVWARGLSLFAVAVALALSGHVVFAFLLNGFKVLGVDFAALDPGRSLIPAAQILLFALQTALIVIALIKSGVDTRRTIVAVSALIWASAMLMLTFVSAQCDLFGACL
jgi:hypothetical protein